MIKKILIFIGIIILILVFNEIALRLFKLVPVHIENESIYPNTFGDYKPCQSLDSDYILPHHITINSLGLRGKEFPLQKPKSTYRILAIGDSYTYGARVSDNQTFPFLLERLLNREPNLNFKFEVINAGHAAYSTREEYEYLLERGVYLKPDMVILAWFPNDIQELSREYSWRSLLKQHYKFEPWKSYIRSSATFNALRIYISYTYIRLKFGPYTPKEKIDIFEENNTPEVNRLWQKCFDYILKTKNFCDSHKIKFLFIALVDPHQINKPLAQIPQKKFMKFTEEHGISFIDTSNKFLSDKNAAQYYLLPQDHHFSAKGNNLVAEQIYEYLNKKYIY